MVADNDGTLLLALLARLQLVQVLSTLHLQLDTDGWRADMVERARNVVIYVQTLPSVSDSEHDQGIALT